MEVTLLDSLNKRITFLNEVISQLGLIGITAIHSRAEEGGKSKEHREKYDIATARAVARMNTLSEYCLPFVRVGGAFVAYKSGDTAEIDEAKSAYKVLGARLKTVEKYELPEGYGERTLAVVEKVQSTPTKYPRGQGKERKNPL